MAIRYFCDECGEEIPRELYGYILNVLLPTLGRRSRMEYSGVLCSLRCSQAWLTKRTVEAEQDPPRGWP